MSDDPFAVIEVAPPAFSAADAVDICRDHYGLDVRASTLVSERDQNFRVDAHDGSQHVLKIASAFEDPNVTDLQIAALRHIAGQPELRVSVPEVRLTLAGEDRRILEKDDRRHVARLVTYLPGIPLREDRLNPSLCRDLGERLASLDRALGNFHHAAADQPLLWDMKRAPLLRRLLVHVRDPRTRQLLDATLTEFEARALPAFDGLRWQVIHNDANPQNLLASADGRHIVGIIDFGDMLRSPLVIELAVAAAYLRTPEGDPLLLIGELLQGYHDVCPLLTAETDILLTLIKTRLATTVLILAWREAIRDDDDAYLRSAGEAEQSALGFLERLATLSPAAVAARVTAD